MQYDSYLAVGDENRSYFFASDNRSIVSSPNRGKYFGVFGGILGPPEYWDATVKELLAASERDGNKIGFFATDQRLTDVLVANGFQANKFGESSIIDLAQNDWKGKKFEWVRRQSNYCRRQNLEFEEQFVDQMSVEDRETLISELLEIERLFLAGRPYRNRLKYVVGEFTGRITSNQRLFVVRNPEKNHFESFVVCNPCENGERLVLECFRRRPDSTRGVMSFMLHQAMKQFQTEGISKADLCIAPFTNCKEPIENDSWLTRKVITLIGDRLGGVYDAKGLHHFKSRFRPQFENLYVSAYPKIDAHWIYYVIAECGFLNLHLGRLLRQVWQSRKSSRG